MRRRRALIGRKQGRKQMSETIETQTQESGQETQIEEQQVETQETDIHPSIEKELMNDDPLSEVFPGRYPLSEMGEEKEVVTPAEVKEKKVEEEQVTTTKKPIKEESNLPGQEEPVQSQKTETNEVAGFKAALIAERRKRQELEEAMRQSAEQKPSWNWDNPEETVQNIVATTEQKFEKRFLDMSQAQAIARHDDYGEKYAVFEKMVIENPAIFNTVAQQPDPAEYAYNLAKQKMFTDEVGSDPAGYEDKLRAKIRSELEQEFNQKVENRIKTVGNLPPSAASLTDKVPQKTVSNDDPLGDIFKDVPS